MKVPCPQDVNRLHHRHSRTPIFVRQVRALVLSALTATVLVACGGGGSGSSSAVTPSAEQAKSAASLSASAPGALVDYVKTKIKQGAGQSSMSAGSNGAVAVSAISNSASGSTAAPDTQTAALASTLLQEAGVEEDDLVKTDGSVLYALRKAYWSGSTQMPAQLQAHRRQTDGQLAAASSLTLDSSFAASGLYLTKDAKQLAVLGQGSGGAVVHGDPIGAVGGVGTLPAPTASTVTSAALLPYQSGKFALDLVSVAQPDSLNIAHRVRIDGQLVGTRMIGNSLYLVSTWMPNLSAYVTSTGAAKSDADLASLTSAALLPTVQIDGQAAQPLLSDTDCYVQPANASVQVQFTTITAIDLSSDNLQRASRCFVGGSQALYMSQANVYLSSSRDYSATGVTTTTVFPSGGSTDIHKFALQGLQITYKGSGVVPGSLGWDSEKVSYRMSEYQGDLRVLSFTGSTGWSTPVVVADSASAPVTPTTPTTGASTLTVKPASPATLTILREGSNQSLQAVGSLPNTRRTAVLGHAGEQVYAVQFAGSRAYVVTFKRTDPLYVLDLSDATDPKSLGELAMSGYSDYLFPLGDSLLFGVGKDASESGLTTGVKVALMNVADLAKPQLLNTMVLGHRGSASALDTSRHGISIAQQGGVYRIALPVRINDTPATNIPAAEGYFAPSYQGLARFEVDTQARTLTAKSTVKSLTYPVSDAVAQSDLYNLGNERSLQLGDAVYYFSGGKFLTSPW